MKVNAKRILNMMYTRFAKASTDVQARITALVQAVGVMDQVCAQLQVLHVRNPRAQYMPADAVKLWDRARKCRARAMGTTFEHEKEVSLRMCLQSMEKLALKLSPPRLDEYILKLEAKQKVDAEREAKKAAAKATRVAKPVQTPFGPVTPSAPKAAAAGGGLPPLNADGIPSWRVGSSADLCARILLGQPAILLRDAVVRAVPLFKSTNHAGRMAMIAQILISLGKLRKEKVGGEVRYVVN